MPPIQTSVTSYNNNGVCSILASAQVLAFYGVPVSRWTNQLGFSTRVLADHTIDGVRAVTLMLSNASTVHLQLWARYEQEPAGDAERETVALPFTYVTSILPLWDM